MCSASEASPFLLHVADRIEDGIALDDTITTQFKSTSCHTAGGGGEHHLPTMLQNVTISSTNKRTENPPCNVKKYRTGSCENKLSPNIANVIIDSTDTKKDICKNGTSMYEDCDDVINGKPAKRKKLNKRGNIVFGTSVVDEKTSVRNKYIHQKRRKQLRKNVKKFVK